jgi:hypothetical protein
MFKFVFKQGLYDLVVKTYDKYLYISNQRKQEFFRKVDNNELQPEDLLIEAVKARQEYFTLVFDEVCNNVAENNRHFKLLLPLKIAAFDFNPDELKPHDIYSFVYWAITNKHADKEICQEIDKYVFNIIKGKIK